MRLAGGVGAFGGAAVLVVLFGAGSAAAVNEYAGQTYADAASAISSGGGTAVVATRIGEYLSTDQCIVTGSRNQNGRIMLDLNCNAPSALDGHPGNSVTTPEGQKIQTLRNDAASISADYARAVDDGSDPYCASHADVCQKVCEAAGTCSAELLEFLGA